MAKIVWVHLNEIQNYYICNYLLLWKFFLKSKVNEKLVCRGIKKIKLHDHFAEHLILSLAVTICCRIEGDKLTYCEKGNVTK